MNKHVKKYCLNYIISDLKPDFAILIKGNWGCGKTYFIQTLIQEAIDNEAIKESEIIKISLYGVTNAQEIDEKIYQVLHPFLSSPKVQFAGAIFRSALKYGTTIDFNKDGKGDGTFSVGGIEKLKRNKTEKIKKKLIIIDDIERSIIDPTIIFGYFSEMILQYGLKAIFIGNEEEYQKNNENEKNKYKKIKEKLIGIEFSITPEIDTAISHFIKELGLNEKTDIITRTSIEVLHTLKYENLRNLRQCFYNIHILLQVLPNDIDDEYLKDIFTIFLILFLQKNQGQINKEDVFNAIKIYKKYNISFTEYTLKPAKDKEYDHYLFCGSIPLANCWESIIFDGNYSNDFISKEFENERNQNNTEERSTLFLLLNNWRKQDKETFKKEITILTQEFNIGKYLHPGEIMHFLNIMCLFSEWHIIPETRESILQNVKDVIEKNKNKICLVRDWNLLSFSYGGWGLSDQITEIVLIRKILKEINQENIKIAVALKLNEYIINDFNSFIRSLMNEFDDYMYHNLPVISLIDIEKLYSVLIQLDNDYQNYFIDALESRYGLKYNSSPDKEYLPDFDNLFKLTQLYKNSIPDVLYNPSGFYKQNITNKLVSLCEHLKKGESS